MPLSPEQLQRILNAQEWDPFSVLGPHRESHGNTEHIRIRAFLPNAAEVACRGVGPGLGGGGLF